MNKSIFNFITLSKLYILLFILVCLSFPLRSQETAELAAGNIENYKEQVKRLVGYLEFSLNTLGSDETSTREKDVLINDSYIKAFRDPDVQVEDDLDDQREVVTYKDVQAYLKDVDFFFKKVEFNYSVKEIQPQFTESGHLFFKVTANRNINGITVEGDTLKNDMLRYIEMNLDEAEQVLKIVSIYTTKINEKKEIRLWWENLSKTWKDILGAGIYLYDSVGLSDIISFDDSTVVIYHDTTRYVDIDTVLIFGQDELHIREREAVTSTVTDTVPFPGQTIYNRLNQVIYREELDISGNLNVRDLEPLRQLNRLRKLNISNTTTDDLFPLRNLTNLEYLDISGTSVTSLEPLLYTTRMKSLILDNTRVSSLKPIRNFSALEILYLNNTLVDSLKPVKNITTLRDLRFADSRISDISPLSDMVRLELLNLSGTEVTTLEPVQYLITLERIFFERTSISSPEHLTRLNSLRVIFADNSQLSSLSGLGGLDALEKIYCDGANIVADTAQSFMNNNPGVLVIYESERLHKWWQGLPGPWKDAFKRYVEVSHPPAKEELHQVTLITSLDLRQEKDITTLEPVSRLSSIRNINASGTGLSDLEGISDLIDLLELDVSGTRVQDLTPLSFLTRMHVVNISNTNVVSIEPLSGLSQLRVLKMEMTEVSGLESLYYLNDLGTVYCDGSLVNTSDVDGLHEMNPRCLVIWQTANLNAWWNTLDEPWKEALRGAIEMSNPPTKEQLHTLVFMKEFKADPSINLLNLNPVPQLRYLESIDVSEGKIRSLDPLSESHYLRKLIVAGNPVEDLAPLSEINTLAYLDISNSPGQDLGALSRLEHLEYLNCSGTQVKKLDPLETLFNLQVLECHNSNVRSLDPLVDLFRLKYVKCYNTRLKDRKVNQFREARPGVEVVYY